MKLLSTLLAATVVTASFAAPAFAASPDVYVVNFRNAQDNNSARLDGQLASALAISGVNAEEVVIDTSSSFSSNEMADKIREMAARSAGSAYMSRASVTSKTTRCPAPHNVDPAGR